MLLVVGTRFNVILGFGRAPRFAPDVKVIMVNTDAEELGKGRSVDLPIVGDARAVLTQLLAEADRAGDWPKETAWVRHLGEVDRRKAAEMAPLLTSDQTPIHPLRLCHELSRFMERDAVLCVDGHDTLNFAGSPSRRSCRGIGSMRGRTAAWGDDLVSCTRPPHQV